jgi:hypothetical protein
MAEEMGVRFLGAVPIDVGFGDLIEGENKGEGEQDAQNKAMEDGNRRQDQNLLVERYKLCRSLPIFERFAKMVIDIIEGQNHGSD